MPDGFTHTDFQIDFEQRLVTCPGGQTKAMHTSGDQGWQAIFKAHQCRDCPLRPRCCTTKPSRLPVLALPPLRLVRSWYGPRCRLVPLSRPSGR
jgi:hypothetical protein